MLANRLSFQASRARPDKLKLIPRRHCTVAVTMYAM